MLEIQEILTRIWENIADRPTGPLALRFYLQPAVATFLAVRHGMKDAREGSTPYFWMIVSQPDKRGAAIREGFHAVAKVMTLAVALDLIYQYKVLDSFYPGEALIVAFLLAYVPYLIVRGPAARIARALAARSRAPATLP
jgi:hypothetical protein